ncbi:glyoxalase/bleomycin resistance protein/dioxygenase [Amycolatopsis mediterranei S699]|uniref:Glyoxalase/bleomycin resistance protein/dioxygenase n=2 Tax=Amycolatopsis mediterranei TaxID=33910 RepID=A0A0H3CZM9_AMYMU|nr:VOC family protein [Amycolatopsis mediterranei]ADJ43545.1 glyoxalase/bleomycin resistance protein/dioxygenase [Amycolatopsis mediterranei U32]AEK40251.1 glyoxalase/bleomycin resistance protein/dioxygenase [Amycolatopsis mediterranei S699]AFO75257.1 glyoxalase/bleomycin resistance protein/dioxygenase [Amycolatopsis mediterranei S699]AGT82386.1 glyoxalase/bleomycin resistance protein/dioxygenase [Amycolatopsis mediterranei RB]KDO03832.1 glyoxalase [Amycolatopsis mediterranei]
MPSSVLNVSVDCADPYELCRFWSEVTGKPIPEEDQPGNDEVGFQLNDDTALLFLRVPEPKTVKNRLHLCLQPDIPRDEEISRILGLGATLVNDLRNPDSTGWAVLADPEGNEFCVLRSAAERAATS